MIPLLAWLRHHAAVLALGYLVWGWRGLLLALVLRETLSLGAAGLQRWAEQPDRPRPAPPPT